MQTLIGPDTTLNGQEKQQVENILVEFNDIFARHRFDIGTNQNFKIKLTPNDERPAYSQSFANSNTSER